MPSIERLTAEDRLILWPDEVWPQDIGALVLLDGSSLLDSEDRFRIETAKQAIEDRLHVLPRFRQVLYVPRRGLGGPLWVDAPAFNLDEHVRVEQLQALADEAALLRAVARLRRRPLDKSRPLWEIWFLTGMSGERVGMFVRLHHVVADGIAGVAELGALLDTAPNSTATPPEPWARAVAIGTCFAGRQPPESPREAEACLRGMTRRPPSCAAHEPLCQRCASFLPRNPDPKRA